MPIAPGIMIPIANKITKNAATESINKYKINQIKEPYT